MRLISMVGLRAQRERDKPRQGVVANTLNLHRNGAVGFIDWLGMPHRTANSVDSRNNIVECVNPHYDPESLFPRDATPIEIRGGHNAEGRQHNEPVWPPRPNVQFADEDRGHKNLSDLWRVCAPK